MEKGQKHRHLDHSITLASLSTLGLLLNINKSKTEFIKKYKTKGPIYLNAACTIGYRISS